MPHRCHYGLLVMLVMLGAALGTQPTQRAVLHPEQRAVFIAGYGGADGLATFFLMLAFLQGHS